MSSNQFDPNALAVQTAEAVKAAVPLAAETFSNQGYGRHEIVIMALQGLIEALERLHAQREGA